jgi:hypothetical protein
MIIIDDIFDLEDAVIRSSRRLPRLPTQLDFPLDSLKSVVVAETNEQDTLRGVKHVYKSQGLPCSSSTQRTWYPPSRGYRTLLGTEIGRLVAAFVLCAWGQGTKIESLLYGF